MKVKILVAGKYNGMDLRNQVCAKGDELETQDWYGEKLIEQGLAKEIVYTPSSTEKAKAPEKKMPVKKNAPSTPTAPANPGNVFTE